MHQSKDFSFAHDDIDEGNNYDNTQQEMGYDYEDGDYS